MSKKQAWMVTVDLGALGTQPRAHFFVVGKKGEMDAVSAVRALPEINSDSEVRARRRLAAVEIAALRLAADEVRPIGH
jgi:hypothetical protein